MLRYSTDRRCMSCQKTYALPAPRWAGVVSILIGAVLVGSCLLVFVLNGLSILGADNAEHVEASMYYGMTCTFLTGGIGVFVIVHGVRLLRQKPIDPPKPKV